MSDSFTAFKLRSPTSNSTISASAPKISSISSIIPPFCICPYCINHHLAYVAEQRPSAGFHVQSQQSSRWSPTPAQLLILEELFRRGTKTPTAEQIQQITLQLRRFGKIEGKNVFYWFQNHKARERQKRRRREMEKTTCEDAKAYNMGSSEKQQEAEAAVNLGFVCTLATGLRETGYEVEETKKWASSSNCSGLADESASLDIAERKSDKWTQFKERETLVLRRKEAKCQNMQMPRSLPYHLEDISPTASTASEAAAAHRSPSSQLLTPLCYSLPFLLNRESLTCYGEENAETHDQTLELFPLKRDRDQDGNSPIKSKARFCCASASVNTEISSNQFFEFLPLKH
ncbi:hypothetical protein L6164_001574 [Bauhinia variegata]|uniref:Uncharacterized protein n=1 Tax=Bauhinia variegata TaxID=167791 RepID=A0ACB9Q9Y4_BAUVA|nr:hypothetical protein L6164_001574 [Bauhinia variegata]